MVHRLVRRWLSLMTVLALVLAPLVQAAHAARMAAAMDGATVSGGPGSEDDCAGCVAPDPGMGLSACIAACGPALVAVLPQPATLGTILVAPPTLVVAPAAIGIASPPDPYPPRPSAPD